MSYSHSSHHRLCFLHHLPFLLLLLLRSCSSESAACATAAAQDNSDNHENDYEYDDQSIVSAVFKRQHFVRIHHAECVGFVVLLRDVLLLSRDELHRLLLLFFLGLDSGDCCDKRHNDEK